MKLKIIEEIDNPLFSRKEIVANIEEEVTPNRDYVKKIISEKFSADIENIKIKKILGRFGSKNFKISANIYKSKEDKNKIEPESNKKSAPNINQSNFSESSKGSEVSKKSSAGE